MKKGCKVIILLVGIILLSTLVVGCSSNSDNNSQSKNKVKEKSDVDVVKDVGKIEEDNSQKKDDENFITLVGNVNENAQDESVAGATVPTIHLNFEDKSFSFSYNALSSYLPMGTYEMTDKKLVLKTDGGKETYFFNRRDEKYIFDFKASIGLDGDFCKYVPDGTEFTKTNL